MTSGSDPRWSADDNFWKRIRVLQIVAENPNIAPSTLRAITEEHRNPNGESMGIGSIQRYLTSWEDVGLVSSTRAIKKAKIRYSTTAEGDSLVKRYFPRSKIEPRANQDEDRELWEASQLKAKIEHILTTDRKATFCWGLLDQIENPDAVMGNFNAYKRQKSKLFELATEQFKLVVISDLLRTENPSNYEWGDTAQVKPTLLNERMEIMQLRDYLDEQRKILERQLKMYPKH